MNSFDVIGNPVRRRIVELLSEQERSAGDLARVVGDEFGISQPAVSNHLRVLRESGFVDGDREGSRRLYALRPGAFDEVQAWVERYLQFWTQRLDALETEIARGQRAARLASAAPPEPSESPNADASASADPTARGNEDPLRD